MLLNQISLRQAGAADWPAIEALLLANKLPTEGAQAHLSTYLLAIANGEEVVGCAGAEVYGPVALLRSVAEDEVWRGRGLGRAILQHLFGIFYERGVPSVALGVDAANPTGATRLYESAGMNVTRNYVLFEKVLQEGK